MATVRRNRSGNWEARVSLGSDPSSGRRRRATRTFPGSLSEGDARRRADDFEREAKAERRGRGQATTGQAGAMTVGEWLDGYVRAKEAFGASPASIPSYKTYIKSYISPRIGRVRLYDLREEQVERMLYELLSSGGRDGGPLSAKTVAAVHAFLQGALSKAVSYGYMQSNPARARMRPRAERGEADALDQEGIDALMSACSGRWDLGAVAARLALGTGMRRAECCGLEWRDVDEATRTVHVVKVVVQKPGGGLVRKDPKSKAGRRAISLDAETWGWLMEWKGVQASRMSEAGLRQGGSCSVLGDDGRHPAPQQLTRAFARLRDDAGLGRCRFHALRHTHATHLLAEGVDVKVLQQRLGHSSAALTLDTYSHVLPGADAAAASAMEGVLARSGRRRGI